jgi:hypothetical protein
LGEESIFVGVPQKPSFDHLAQVDVVSLFSAEFALNLDRKYFPMVLEQFGRALDFYPAAVLAKKFVTLHLKKKKNKKQNPNQFSSASVLMHLS